MSVRVMQQKYIAPDGTVYDSKDEYLYLQILLTDKLVTCIHRQVKLNIFHTLYMIVPKQLKTKISRTCYKRLVENFLFIILLISSCVR